jgi:hypothetical protein
MKRFGLSPGGMVNVLQQSTGDKADHKPESRLQHCFESGRHKFQSCHSWNVKAMTHARAQLSTALPVRRAPQPESNSFVFHVHCSVRS